MPQRYREYVSHKSTGDKIESVMNEMDALGFDEIMPVYTGGRDWVVVASRDYGKGEAHEFGDSAPRTRKNGVTVIP